MKKRFVYALATLIMLIGCGSAFAAATDGGTDPPPTCNPLTDPRCK